MVYLTRVERFNAAHKLWVKEWTEEETSLLSENVLTKIGTVTTIIFM